MCCVLMMLVRIMRVKKKIVKVLKKLPKQRILKKNTSQYILARNGNEKDERMSQEGQIKVFRNDWTLKEIEVSFVKA